LRVTGHPIGRLAIVLLTLGPAGAQAAPAEPPAMRLAPPDLPWGRVIWGTLLVVGLICIGVFLLKKLGGGALLGRGRYVELLEVRPVARGVHLFLVRVAGRVVLLGSTAENVTRLAEFSEDELPRPEPQEEPVGLDGFKSLLRKFAGAGR